VSLNHYFQTANSRSGFSDYKIISHLDWHDKNGTAQVTDIVLTISNWHFNRDTLKDNVAPFCKLENIMVTLKLSSSVFEPSTSPTGGVTAEDGEQPRPAGTDEAGSNSGEKAYTSPEGDVFFFDKNGCIVPFVAFNQLLDSEQLQTYLTDLKCKFETKPGQKGPSTPMPSADEDDEELVTKKRLERKRRIRMLYAQNKKKAPEFANDGDDDDEEDDDDNDGRENEKDPRYYATLDLEAIQQTQEMPLFDEPDPLLDNLHHPPPPPPAKGNRKRGGKK